MSNKQKLELTWIGKEIPHDAIAENMTLAGLAASYTCQYGPSKP